MELRWPRTLFPFFPPRRGKAARCRPLPGETRKKKIPLVFNFPRTQTTQGERKHRDG